MRINIELSQGLLRRIRDKELSQGIPREDYEQD